MVRDNALAVSGLLSARMGGPSVHPYQPLGYWAYLNFPPREWDDSPGDDQYRRGLYTWWQRAFPQPSLVAFDAPSREECVADRVRSNVPQQALALLNDPTYVEAARAFAARILREGGTHDRGAPALGLRARAVARAERRGGAGARLAPGESAARVRAPTGRGAAAVATGQAPLAKDLTRGGARRLDPGRPRHPEPARAHHPVVSEGPMEILTDDLARSASASPAAPSSAARARASAPWRFPRSSIRSCSGPRRPRARPGRGRGRRRCTSPPRAKRVIHLYQAGGPSHLELFDYKPKLAAHARRAHARVRSPRASPSPSSRTRSSSASAPSTRSRRYGAVGPGDHDPLPEDRRKSPTRSASSARMQTEQINHDPAHTFMNTGTQISGRPAAGAWVWYGLGSRGRRTCPASSCSPPGPGRPDAAHRGAAVAQRLPAQPLPGRALPLQGRRRALPARPRGHDPRPAARRDRRRRRR